MNCPQCQEQLDERLDELRPGLRSGTLSPDAARAQARKALEEAVSQCLECEDELRAHVQVRLALMLPDREVASVAIPSDLRLNVRRALERENAVSTARPYSASAWNPLKGFAWTGGAILSAVALFIVARPLLIERAQQPLPDMAASVEPAPPQNGEPQGVTGSPSPSDVAKKGAVGQPPRPLLRKAVPPKALALPPLPSQPTRIGTPAPVHQEQQSNRSVVTPPSIPRVAVPPRPLRSVAPVPQVVVPPPATSASQTPARTQDKPPEGAKRQSLVRPRTMMSAPPVPMVGSSPMVASSAPTKEPFSAKRSNSSLPTEPRLKDADLAPSGKALGLTVRFVPSAPSQANADIDVTSNGGRTLFAAPAPAPAPVAPQSGEPSGGFGGFGGASANSAPPENSTAARTAAPSAKDPGVMRSRIAPDKRAAPSVQKRVVPSPEARSMADSTQATTSADSSSTAKSTLSVSVEEEVVNARIVGQVQGREGEGVLLWSGNAAARKPITVPLEPLKANKGDTVNVSFQQQVSLGQTKTLATTSVVVP